MSNICLTCNEYCLVVVFARPNLFVNMLNLMIGERFSSHDLVTSADRVTLSWHCSKVLVALTGWGGRRRGPVLQCDNCENNGQMAVSALDKSWEPTKCCNAPLSWNLSVLFPRRHVLSREIDHVTRDDESTFTSVIVWLNRMSCFIQVVIISNKLSYWCSYNGR
jgi:hypothetical protein